MNPCPNKKELKKKIKAKLKVIKKARGRGIKIPQNQVIPDKRNKIIEDLSEEEEGEENDELSPFFFSLDDTDDEDEYED